ncbi:SH3 domain-containing protein [Caerostris darwini]|uniref:SH3 domain-containing protein n=1 Tax=Caerostris darwini TaxID=1538125 RepID=A0AAV4UGS5_9ARAC|nr:SH3 domain-containing protein [Caerostris darwini]
MRKLSLNWFRSLSYSPPDANRPEGATAKNNNADYTRMRHYSTIPEDRRSETAKISNDVIRVVKAHTAAPNSDELTINCGDRLHLVEIEEKRPMWSLVRRISDDAQGWVPSTCLRLPSVSSISSPNINNSLKTDIDQFLDSAE